MIGLIVRLSWAFVRPCRVSGHDKRRAVSRRGLGNGPLTANEAIADGVVTAIEPGSGSIMKMVVPGPDYGCWQSILLTRSPLSKRWILQDVASRCRLRGGGLLAAEVGYIIMERYVIGSLRCSSLGES